MHTLDAGQLAAQIGKSKDWVYHNWKKLVREGMPPPIQDGQLVWSAVQVYAWLDRNLPDDLKVTVAAYRAAEAAAKTAKAEVPDTKDWGAILRQRLENLGS